MAHLSTIKHRIRSIQKTEKITKAMRMIAMSFYSRLEKQRALVNHYRNEVITMISMLEQQGVTLPPLVKPVRNAPPRPLIIFCSSVRGLCGPLNAGITRFFEKSFITERKTQTAFIGIGSRACAYLTQRKPGIVVDKIESYSVATIERLASSIISHIAAEKEHPYTSVHIYYTKIKNLFIQTPEQEQLIPLSLPPEEERPLVPHTQESYRWEQDMIELGVQITRNYLYAQLVHALFNNCISENAARFVAMDHSTTNATKYIDSLNLSYNKSRQNVITREIAELSSNL